MKHLKLFEAYKESDFDKNKLQEDIENIFIDIIDNGFDAKAFINDSTFKNESISIEIDNEFKDWFKLSDIYENVLVFIDYMKEKYPDYKFHFMGEIYGSDEDDEYAKLTNIEEYENTTFSFISLNFERIKN